MKRSEMLRIIYEAIKHFHEDTGGEVASLVLDEIEAAGMLPPTTRLSKLGTIDNAWDEE